MTSLTLEDAESSFLMGKAEFEKWFLEFQTNWYMPLGIDLLGVMVNTMPMESRMIDPLATSAAELAFKNLKGG